MDQDPENRIVFHGTHGDHDTFDPAFLGTGGDPNSALGFHFTDIPGEAAEYAEAQAGRSGREARVLAVRTLTRNPTSELDYYGFFGYDEDGAGVRDHAGFADLRRELLARGHDSVDYEDGEQAIFVVLDASLIEVVAVLAPDEALACHEAIAALPDRQDDGARLRVVEAIVAARAPSPGR
jgi:hypothetical protein